MKSSWLRMKITMCSLRPKLLACSFRFWMHCWLVNGTENCSALKRRCSPCLWLETIHLQRFLRCLHNSPGSFWPLVDRSKDPDRWSSAGLASRGWDAPLLDIDEAVLWVPACTISRGWNLALVVFFWNPASDVMGDLCRTWWLWGVLLGLGSPDSYAVTYTLHRSSILTSRPSFEMRYRVELDPLEVTVKEPALEQSG